MSNVTQSDDSIREWPDREINELLDEQPRRMPLPPNRVQRRGRSDEPQTSQHATQGMTQKQMLPMRLVRLAHGTSGGTAQQEPSTGIVRAF